MMIMLFIGVADLVKQKLLSCETVGLLGGISILISFALPIDAISFYATYIKFPSPWLNFFH
jgi:hypothetical protein